MSLSVIVVLGLAVARLWRLLAVDTILDPLRDRACRSIAIAEGVKKNGRPRLVEFLACPWCLGFWLSIPAVALYRYAPDDVVLWIVGVLAVSEVVGLIVRNLDPKED